MTDNRVLEINVDQALMSGPADLVDSVDCLELETKSQEELMAQLHSLVEGSQMKIDELSEQVQNQMDSIEQLQEVVLKQQKLLMLQQETIVQMDRGLKAVGSATVSGFWAKRRWYDKIKEHVLSS